MLKSRSGDNFNHQRKLNNSKY